MSIPTVDLHMYSPGESLNILVQQGIIGNLSGISYDAGGRQRVSQFTTLGDYKVLNADRALLFDNVGTGTGAYSTNKYNMSVTSTQYLIRQTEKFHPYFSGKSQFIECTFDGFAPEVNVTKRFGYFSSSTVSPHTASYDGFYVENNGTTISFKADRLGVNTLNVDIAAWDGYDNLAEYQTLSTWGNFTVVAFDFLWLGGAVLRLWVKTSNGFVLAHTFNYSGTAADTMISSPNQPVRYEIRSSTGSGSFRYICSQVSTEGSVNEMGLSRTVLTGHTAISLATVGTKYPLIGVRKLSASRDVAVKVVDIAAFVTSVNDQAVWTLELNPTITLGAGAFTYATVANSSLQSATGDGVATVTAAGTILAGGFLTQNAVIPPNLLVEDFLSYLGSTIAGVMDQIVLCVTPVTATVGTLGAIKVKEF